MQNPLPILDGQGAPEPEGTLKTASEKLMELKRALAPRVRDGVLVAFSGGMDSAFLLWAAAQVAGEREGRVAALTTTSPSTPSRDREDAARFAEALGIEHHWRESGEVSLPAYVQNDRERCYHCKTELFRIAAELREELAMGSILYGYNASDQGDHRPGHTAAQEAGVLSPLSEAGLTKSEIRLLMEDAGLELSTKPASPCLSSRIMTGIPVTPQRLDDVQAMEEILRRAGVSVLRVRICRDQGGNHFLRVEVAEEEMEAVLKVRRELQEEGRARGYRWVTLDLGGYTTGGGVT